MIKVTLKGGVVKEYEAGISVLEIAKDLGAGLYKAACAAKIGDKVVDLRTPVTEDCELAILTFDDEQGKKAFWHTASHVLAQAVKRLFPSAKFAIGPAIDGGFYYDFDVEKPFTAEDLLKIEAEMKKIVKEGIPLERFELEPADALELMKDEPFKLELIQEHAGKGEKISFFKQGDFTDLCAGPHLPDTSRIKAFKLTSSTGAYWRGDSKKAMLCRVYGTAFPKASELEAHLTAIEEAKKRDHNKIGRELEYFTTSDMIGQGLPIMLPKGARVIQQLQRFVEDEEERRGYLLTKTPLMAKSDLYKVSGHWDHYKDGMFVLGDEEKDDEVFALRPMTCPFQYQVFLNRMRSYRDLPMRLGETSTLFRNESSGEMHGLIRVRQFTISEGHLIVRPEQLEEEFRGCVELANFMLETVGLKEDASYRFSKWDPNNKDKYEGTTEQWETAQAQMRKILDHLGMEYTEEEGEAAFYGPKLDIQLKNVHGKEDTAITVQIDMMLAKKFGMEYVDTDGSKTTPYIIHRTSLGCYERTLALLIEKYAGALPMWMMPTQVEVLPIGERQHEAAKEIVAKLKAAGIRTELDDRNEKIGYKIREAQMEKTPYMIVLGDKEIENNVVAVRNRKEGDMGTMSLDAFIALAKEEIETKAIK
ncbi:threonyl-tRNA synthetase [Hydrogenoanaerobacterium saccharovorans]|uniref:Threonine--tRNA ligase n=1 Tax=Hydrogenoanaerobacterium saccharovorans TaxID=474960 RepID=A0A1H8D2I3_9FIRM|nr:threonine--tRNA ligase [Hydrogenoanaerobacterium saccharovorans]RPF43449.1 threonyl-tRNA synthetase [Hydrogenoanaerobacterium saccharovorans]SEN01435.1 threonyl-tRNA synthetase [Hydrogenoanaerobacterium saccharovorans]